MPLNPPLTLAEINANRAKIGDPPLVEDRNAPFDEDRGTYPLTPALPAFIVDRGDQILWCDNCEESPQEQAPQYGCERCGSTSNYEGWGLRRSCPRCGRFGRRIGTCVLCGYGEPVFTEGAFCEQCNRKMPLSDVELHLRQYAHHD